MDKFKVASAQYPLIPSATILDWRRHTDQWVLQAKKNQAQLLVFPEYASLELLSLLHKPNASVAEQLHFMQTVSSQFLEQFETLAKKHGMYILAPSFPEKIVDGVYVNRSYIFSPQGGRQFQEKNRITRMENETWQLSHGQNELKVITCSLGDLAIQICYDVEFALYSNLLAHHGASVILVPAATKTNAGLNRVHNCARARSVETQAYTVVAQTVGTAPWAMGLATNHGMAAAYSPCDHYFPDNGILNQGVTDTPEWIYQDLDLKLIEKARRNGEVFNLQDHADLLPQQPQISVVKVSL